MAIQYSSEPNKEIGPDVSVEQAHRFSERLVLDTSEGGNNYLLIGENRSYIKLSPSAYHLLRSISTGMSFDDLASKLSVEQGHPVSPDEVQTAYEHVAEQVAKIEAKTNLNPRGFWFSYRLVPEEIVAKIARPLSAAFHPAVALCLFAVIILATIFIIHSNFFMSIGQQLYAQPMTFWKGYGLFLISLIFHEFGHASACARYGARPGSIGFAAYLIYPAFYSDVNSAWQLKSRQRVVVDLGGVFFQLVVGSVYAAVFMMTGYQSLRVAVLMVVASCLFSLNPVLKFDGYWVVADALGVVNLGKQRKRVLSHIGKRLRRKESASLPWPMSVTMILAFYSVFSFGFWVFFILRIGPVLWHRLAGYPHELLSVVSPLLKSPHVLMTPHLNSFFVSTYTVFIFLLIFQRMAGPLLTVAKSGTLSLIKKLNYGRSI